MTREFALISYERGFTNAQIVATGTEARMLEKHAATDYGTGTFYSVRPADHEMTLGAMHQTINRIPVKVAPRVATRIVGGVRFLKTEDGWVTEDGRYEVSYVDDFETECGDDPHPMRVTKADRARYARATEHERTSPYAEDAFHAIRDGRKGWVCEGNGIHFYGLWVAGAVSGEPQVISRNDRLIDAMGAVVNYIETGEVNA